MSDLSKVTDRLKSSLDKIDASLDQVFVDINSTFVEVDRMFDEIGKEFGDFDQGLETTINGKKIVIKVDSLGNVFVNGKKVVEDTGIDLGKKPQAKKFEDIKPADVKTNPLNEETETTLNRIVRNLWPFV